MRIPLLMGCVQAEDIQAGPLKLDHLLAKGFTKKDLELLKEGEHLTAGDFRR